MRSSMVALTDEGKGEKRRRLERKTRFRVGEKHPLDITSLCYVQLILAYFRKRKIK